MYTVEIKSDGGYKFSVRSKDYEFSSDIKGQGMSPPDILLGSLGSCIGVYVHKYLEGAKLEAAGLRIKIEADFPKEPPMCFKEIKVNIYLEGVELDERRRLAMLEFIKNCPIHNTLKAAPAISVNLG